LSRMVKLGPVSSYLAAPTSVGPWPAVVVIHEWRGLDTQTESIADRLAGIGYLAFAPDLFHGELAPFGDQEKASELTHKYGPGAPDELMEAFDALKGRPDCSGKVGSMGFCFGGRMSLAMGIRRPLAAVCTFYGGGMQQLFDELNKLKSPVLGLFGDEDKSIPVGTVEQFDKLLDDVGVEHEIVVYPNSGHAFFRDEDPSVYKPEAAKNAWERVKVFFAKNLN